MPGRPWTVTDIATAVKMIESGGYSYENIGERLGRSSNSVYWKMHRHGLPKIGRAARPPLEHKDVEPVMKLHRMGYTYTEIAIKTNRTRNSVAGIVYRNRK